MKRTSGSPNALHGRVGERGQTSVLFVWIALTLALFTMLAIQVASLVREKLVLQQSADAVAFSAATNQAQGLNAIARVNRRMRDEYADRFLPFIERVVFPSREAGERFIEQCNEHWDRMRAAQMSLNKERFGARTLTLVEQAARRNAPTAKVDVVSFFKYDRTEKRFHPSLAYLMGENGEHGRGFVKRGTFRYRECHIRCVVRTAPYEVEVWSAKDRARTTFVWVRLTSDDPDPIGRVLPRFRRPNDRLVAESLATPFGGSIGDASGHRDLFRPSYQAKLASIASPKLAFANWLPHSIVRVLPFADFEEHQGDIQDSERRDRYAH